MKKFIVYLFSILLMTLGCTSRAMKESKSLIGCDWERLIDRAVHRKHLVRSLSAPSVLGSHYQPPKPSPLVRPAVLNMPGIHAELDDAPLNFLGALLISNYKLSIFLAERISFDPPPPQGDGLPDYEVSDYIAELLDELFDCVQGYWIEYLSNYMIDSSECLHDSFDILTPNNWLAMCQPVTDFVYDLGYRLPDDYPTPFVLTNDNLPAHLKKILTYQLDSLYKVLSINWDWAKITKDHDKQLRQVWRIIRQKYPEDQLVGTFYEKYNREPLTSRELMYNFFGLYGSIRIIKKENT